MRHLSSPQEEEEDGDLDQDLDTLKLNDRNQTASQNMTPTSVLRVSVTMKIKNISCSFTPLYQDIRNKSDLFNNHTETSG